MLTRKEQTQPPWQLHGLSLQVALFAGVGLLAGAVLAAAVDRYSHVGWDSPALQTWTLVPQTLASVGLLFIGQRLRSVAFYILAALVGLIVIEEAFHVLNPVADWLAEATRWTQEWTDVRLSVLNGVLVYALVGVAGIAILLISHVLGSKEERPVIRRIALLLLVGGVFGGPIALLSEWTNNWRWSFVEESGEAIVFATIASYVAGLVVRWRVGATSRRLRPTRLGGNLR